jgi:hypothetical protein
MQHRTLITSLVMSVTLFASPTLFADEPEQRGDRAIYQRLIREIREVDAQFASVVDKAMKQARQNNGDAELETQAELLALRDKRDRLMNRFTLIALRWGWEIPDFDDPTSGKAAPVTDPKDDVFDPARRIIKGRFKQEALRIARSLELPVIPLRAPEAKGRKP